MKLSEILKQQGLFSQDIKIRINNKQISINGESVSDDIDVDCVAIKNKRRDVTGIEMGNEIAEVIDAGDFIFWLISNKNWLTKIQIFGFENLFNTNIENDLTLFLKSFILLKISKKQILVLKRAM